MLALDHSRRSLASLARNNHHLKRLYSLSMTPLSSMQYGAVEANQMSQLIWHPAKLNFTPKLLKLSFHNTFLSPAIWTFQSASSFLQESLWFLKRTFQPSLVRMKRKHGFLARLRTRNGKKILNRRREKGRTRLSN